MSLTSVELQMIELLVSRANEEQRKYLQVLVAGDVMVKPETRTTPALSFKVGDRVIFKGRKTRPPVIGTIKSMNEKTYTITDCNDGGPGWRIHPSFLKHYAA